MEILGTIPTLHLCTLLTMKSVLYTLLNNIPLKLVKASCVITAFLFRLQQSKAGSWGSSGGRWWI